MTLNIIDLSISKMANGLTKRETIMFNLQNVVKYCKNLKKMQVKIQRMNSSSFLVFDPAEYENPLYKQQDSQK